MEIAYKLINDDNGEMLETNDCNDILKYIEETKPLNYGVYKYYGDEEVCLH